MANKNTQQIVFFTRGDNLANLMFVGSPGTHFICGLTDPGGVRLIV